MSSLEPILSGELDYGRLTRIGVAVLVSGFVAWRAAVYRRTMGDVATRFNRKKWRRIHQQKDFHENKHR